MKTVRLYSGANPFIGFYNFGDALGIRLVERLSGRPVALYPMESADIVGPGSILGGGPGGTCSPREAFRRVARRILFPHRQPLKVWGAGFICPPTEPCCLSSRACEICAVRGRLSLEILRKAGVVSEKVVPALGDPGLLYPMLLERLPEKTFDVGVVPHYVDKMAGRNICERLLAKGVRAVCIDVNGEDGVAVLRQIASCRAVLSSSLHGCIVSDAMGIPNRLIQLSMLSMKPSPDYLDYAFKFLDYYSVYGRSEIKPLQLNEFYDDPCGVVERIRSEYDIDGEKVKAVQQALLAAFPFPHPDSEVSVA